MSLYQALFGKLPPSFIPYVLGSSKNATLDEILLEKDVLLKALKENLAMAKCCMELQANLKRRELKFTNIDLVLLKLQPYQQDYVKRHSK